jgi:hypothetical protein
MTKTGWTMDAISKVCRRARARAEAQGTAVAGARGAGTPHTAPVTVAVGRPGRHYRGNLSRSGVPE